MWLLFMLMLVIAKPLFLDRGFEARTRRAPGKDLLAAPKISLVLLARRGSASDGLVADWRPDAPLGSGIGVRRILSFRCPRLRRT